MSALAEPTGLAFNAVEHSYTLDGRPVPGVTTALKVISAGDYAMVDPAVLERKARFGTAVHRMIDLDCKRSLDLGTLDQALVPYYFAWRDFLACSGFQVVLSESKVGCRRYGYAGQLDLFGLLNGVPAVIDAKCVVAVMRSTGPQTAAYERGLRSWRPEVLPEAMPCQRFALQLFPGADGVRARWQLVPFRDSGDFRTFLACLAVYQFLKGPKK